MAIKGSLKEASLADVCQLLAMGQKTGCLSVTDRARFGQIYFDRGRITHATIVNRRDRLGDLLVRDGVIEHEQLRQVVERQSAEPEKRLGELLVESGLLTRAQLENYIRIQAEEAVYSLFTWSRGSFYFEVDQKPDDAEILLSINPESLLLEGARRVDEWSLIEKKIPTLDLIFQVETDRLRAADVELTPEQERILPLLDGKNTVQELADRTGLGEFEAGKALYGLVQAGFAYRVGRRAAADAPKVRDSEVQEHRNLGIAFYRTGLLEEAAREFRHVLELRPGDIPSRTHLALIDLHEGRERDAVRLLKRLVEDTGPSYAAFVNLAYALERLGRLEDALLVLDEAERLRPGTAAVALARGILRLRAGDPAAAEAEFGQYRERLAAGTTPAAVFFHFAALAAALAGRLDEAAGIVREGLEAHPAAAPLHLLLGSIAERSGDLDEAERAYRHAAEEDPALAQAHKCLGDLAYRQKLFDDALDHYERAARTAPDLGDDLHTKLGNLYYKRNDREKALECWRRALELNPANHVVRNNIEVVSHALT
ncbi:MAG TPA: DUF4388 domain-containing protein [Longimicrobiales bacterium]